MKILIVDDSPTQRKLFETTLKSGGYTDLVFAESPKKAFHLMGIDTDKQPEILPDLILMDIVMPEINGIEACRRIKSIKDFQDIPIIMATVSTDDKNLEKAFEAGAMDFLHTPFKKVELLARIGNSLNLKQERDQRKKRESELKQLNAQKDKFFSIISHDLRSPFTVLFSTTKMMVKDMDTFDKEELKMMLEVTESSAKKLFRLLENLLQWGNLQLENIEYDPTSVNINELVERNIQLLAENAKKKELVLSFGTKEEAYVYADKHMINSVIQNIISNAIKFTDAGNKIKITSKDKDAFIEVSIADSGVGIDKENLEKLFRIDARYTTLGTAQETGSGLGLILCKEFVEKNGGKIWVKTKVNKGTTVKFTLPKAV